MDILNLLKSDHEAILAALSLLNDEIESRKEDGQWLAQDQFHELKKSIIAHNRSEEAVFYEALRTKLAADEKPQDLFDLRDQEHRDIEEAIEDLEASDPLSSEWATKLMLLKTQFQNHVEDEEHAIFAMAQNYCSEGQLKELAHEFQEKRKSLMATLPLHYSEETNLTQAPHL